LSRWEDASWPSVTDANSIRVYLSAPATERVDDTDLVRIAYPRPTPIPDAYALRTALSRYVAADGGEFGNWTSKASLREGPLALDRPARAVPTTQGVPVLAEIARAHPGRTHLFAVGVDRFQMPVFQYEFVLGDTP
jgi:hypothetical protein